MAVFGAFALGAPKAAQAQTGSIRGQVTNRETGQPIVGAKAVLVGTNRIAQTNERGEYEFSDVRAGPASVRISLIGFESKLARVTVVVGRTTRVDFSVAVAVFTLDAIVVTPTGDRRQREVPNAITTIDAVEAVREAMPINLAGLIQGRAPGVQIINMSGTTGSGTKVRIRGSSSVSLTNEPLLVVDGIRVDNRASDDNFRRDGQTISRLNDFNPGEIESIDIVKGPSATALYGTEAANGVIVIKTKRGHVGAPVWSAYTEQGVINEIGDYPFNFRGIDAAGDSCRLANVSAGTCTQAGLEMANPLESSTTSPFDNGRRQQYGVNVGGGSEAVQYFVSGEWEVEDGVYGLPEGVRDSIVDALDELPSFVESPNKLERASIRVNLNARLYNNLDLSTSIGYVTAEINTPPNDNNVTGILPSGLLGLSDSTDQGGYGFFLPEDIMFVQTQQSIDRFTNSVSALWRPTTWLEGRATFGVDYTARADVVFQQTGTGPNFATSRQGERGSDKVSTWQYTVDVGATGQFQLTDRISSKTSVGFQYFRNNREQLQTQGEILAPGSGSQKSASNQFIDEDFIESRTVGTFFEQQFGLDDRLYLIVAVRGDDNSAFGQDFDFTTYPKFGLSYLLVEDRTGLLNNLRLRGAWGASGQQPGSNTALRFFQGFAVAEAGEELSGVEIAGAGNTALKPERSEEIETGFDAGLLDGRVGFEFTFYRRKTTDALISRRLAPSLGLTPARFENIGETLNYGFEGGINATILRSPNFTWDLRLSGSTNTNEIKELGEGVEDIVFGSQRHSEGFPLGAYFQEDFEFRDANGDGIITTDELNFDLDGDGVTDEPVFQGYPRPRYEVSFFNSFDFLDLFRISGLFDYRGGHKLENFTEAFRCRSPFNLCQGLNDPNASLEEQARAQTQLSSVQTLTGFMEPGWFIKLRELSFTFFAPESWARAVRVNRWSITFTGRNLATITDYTGLDPEVQQGIGNFGSREFLTQPQVRYWTARFQVTF